MKWLNSWNNMMQVTELWGIDRGFWIAMIVCVVVVALMNGVFWGVAWRKNKER